MDSDPKDLTYYKVVFFTYLFLTVLTLGTAVGKFIKGSLALNELVSSIIAIIPIVFIFKTFTSFRRWQNKKKEEGE